MKRSRNPGTSASISSMWASRVVFAIIEAAAMLAERASPRMMPRCGAGHWGILRASTRTKSGRVAQSIYRALHRQQPGVINVDAINFLNFGEAIRPANRILLDLRGEFCHAFRDREFFLESFRPRSL